MRKNRVKNENNSEFTIDLCKGLEDLRRGNVESIKQSRQIAFDGGNSAESNINRQLINAAALLIPVVFSLGSVQEIRSQLNQTNSLMVKISLIFMLVSLLLGLIHIYEDHVFYKKWFKLEEKKLKPWASTSFFPSDPAKIRAYLKEYESIKKQIDCMDSEVESSETTKIFLIIQSIFWLIGVLFLIIATFQLLP